MLIEFRIASLNATGAGTLNDEAQVRLVSTADETIALTVIIPAPAAAALRIGQGVDITVNPRPIP